MQPILKNTKKIMQEKNESPINVIGTSGSATTKKYYTADEAMTFIEPQIRAMFR